MSESTHNHKSFVLRIISQLTDVFFPLSLSLLICLSCSLLCLHPKGTEANVLERKDAEFWMGFVHLPFVMDERCLLSLCLVH